jgi:hypothetical protein
MRTVDRGLLTFKKITKKTVDTFIVRNFSKSTELANFKININNGTKKHRNKSSLLRFE